VELDPGDFDFGGGADVSALLRLAAWIDEAAAGVPVDDGFRRLPPALAPEEARGSVASALQARPAGPARRDEARVVLDNTGQFRSYSAWRATVERRR
jgi:hypothetical protein